MTHSLHYILSEVYTKRLTISVLNAPMDYLELPTGLFELIARDWVDFILGKTLSDPPSACPNYSAEAVRHVLEAGVEQYCAHEETDCTFATVLGMPDFQAQWPTLDGTINNLLEGTPVYSYVYSMALAPMVYQRGNYREKVWNIYQEYTSTPRDHKGVHNDNPGLHTDHQGVHNDDLYSADSVTPSESEAGMRNFFASGLRNFGFETFLGIVPGLEAITEESNHLEEIIDFGPLIAEIMRPDSDC